MRLAGVGSKREAAEHSGEAQHGEQHVGVERGSCAPTGCAQEREREVATDQLIGSETAAFRYTFRPHPNGMGTNEGHHVNQHAELGLGWPRQLFSRAWVTIYVTKGTVFLVKPP